MQNTVASTVAVIGLGKIGLPLAVQYARQGKYVIGCDINPHVVDTVRRGHAHIDEEPGLQAEVSTLVQKGLLTATTDTTGAVRQAEVVVVIVPVVVDENHEPNFQGIDAATTAIGDGLQPRTLVIYETTLPVGTTATRFGSLLQQRSNLLVGQDFYLAYSPERVSSGQIFQDLQTYPKVVAGVNSTSTEEAVAFYRSVLDAEIITMASTDEAEFVKLIETTYRDVNIALANEYARFADAHGLDVTTAIAAANTQPYSHIHTPGVGVGGHCIPVYPYFLLQGVKKIEQAQESLLQTAALAPLTLPRAARRINDSMADYATRRIEAVIGPLASRSVLILGVAYRGDVRETAFTSARLLQDALQTHGANVYVDDPLFSVDQLHRLGYRAIAEGDKGKIEAIIVQAGHKAYTSLDFSVFTGCRVVLDGRRVLQRERIEALGMSYIAIGDGHVAEQKAQQLAEPFALASSQGGQ